MISCTNVQCPYRCVYCFGLCRDANCESRVILLNGTEPGIYPYNTALRQKLANFLVMAAHQVNVGLVLIAIIEELSSDEGM